MLIPLVPMGAPRSTVAPSPNLDSFNASPVSLGSSAITPWRPRPVLGGQETLVLLVEFPDVRFRSSISEIGGLVTTVDEWFRTSSYGKMYIDYTIYEEILALPGTMASYGAPEQGAGRGDSSIRLDQYVSNTFDLVFSQTSLDLTNFKHVVIVHSGGDEASGAGNPNEIWSFCACDGPYADENPEEASWKLVDESGQIVHAFWGVSTFSEDEPWAILAHEFSHSLGLNDLYIYGEDGYSEGSGVGFWSMMDAGAILDPPADLDGWSKYILGWTEPVVVDSVDGEYTIYTLESAKEPKALLVKIGDSPNEYYFVHSRRMVGTDSALPSEGVIVFKIDATRYRSHSGSELALIIDANPDTPQECYELMGAVFDDCRTLDAPYNEKGKRYSFSYGLLSASIVLNNDVFWDEDSQIGFRVQAVGDDSFKITFGISPEQVPTTATTTTEQVTTPQCVIATAAYGSVLGHEVKFMRDLRDGMAGSSRTGALLVRAWNAFYYTWSPALARLISGSKLMQAIFGILLLPLMVIVHVTAGVFWTVMKITSLPDLASFAGFTVAALLSVIAYLVLPALVAARLMKNKLPRRVVHRSSMLG